MHQISEKTNNIIYSYVRSDLQPSLIFVSLRVGLALLLGGILSMFFCGQFGIGFSEIARGWNHTLHAHMGATQCAIVCGVIFSIVPVFFLRICTSGILFRKIIRQYSLVQAAMITIAGSSMYFGGNIMNELINVSVWTLSALISFKLVGFITDEISNITNLGYQ